jgi:glycosyltransferase involved in cell wall biosynthesis
MAYNGRFETQHDVEMSASEPQTHRPFLSVVISTRRRRERLTDCLLSLAAQTYPRDGWEVIVVEDGDTDPLDDGLISLRHRLPLRWFRVSHAGCGGAKNAGAWQAHGQYLVFTDDDCRFAPGWLSQYGRYFERTPDGLIAGAAINPRTANRYSDASQELVNYVISWLNASPHEARLAIGNNFGVPAKEFRKLGGFNPAYFPMGGEDRDFAASWVESGRQIVYAPDIVVQHAQELSLRSLLKQQFHYGRGAYIFHRLDAERRWGRVKLERPGFYLALFLWPWSVRSGAAAARMAVLFLCAQAAHAAGYLSRSAVTHRDGQIRVAQAIARPAAVDLSNYPQETSPEPVSGTRQ